MLCALCALVVALTGRKQLTQLSENYSGILEKQKNRNELLKQKDWLRGGLAARLPIFFAGWALTGPSKMDLGFD